MNVFKCNYLCIKLIKGKIYKNQDLTITTTRNYFIICKGFAQGTICLILRLSSLFYNPHSNLWLCLTRSCPSALEELFSTFVIIYVGNFHSSPGFFFFSYLLHILSVSNLDRLPKQLGTLHLEEQDSCVEGESICPQK